MHARTCCLLNWDVKNRDSCNVCCTASRERGFAFVKLYLYSAVEDRKEEPFGTHTSQFVHMWQHPHAGYAREVCGKQCLAVHAHPGHVRGNHPFTSSADRPRGTSGYTHVGSTHFVTFLDAFCALMRSSYIAHSARTYLRSVVNRLRWCRYFLGLFRKALETNLNLQEQVHAQHFSLLPMSKQQFFLSRGFSLPLTGLIHTHTREQKERVQSNPIFESES